MKTVPILANNQTRFLPDKPDGIHYTADMFDNGGVQAAEDLADDLKSASVITTRLGEEKHRQEEVDKKKRLKAAEDAQKKLEKASKKAIADQEKINGYKAQEEWQGFQVDYLENQSSESEESTGELSYKQLESNIVGSGSTADNGLNMSASYKNVFNDHMKMAFEFIKSRRDSSNPLSEKEEALFLKEEAKRARTKANKKYEADIALRKTQLSNGAVKQATNRANDLFTRRNTKDSVELKDHIDSLYFASMEQAKAENQYIPGSDEYNSRIEDVFTEKITPTLNELIDEGNFSRAEKIIGDYKNLLVGTDIEPIKDKINSEKAARNALNPDVAGSEESRQKYKATQPPEYHKRIDEAFKDYDALQADMVKQINEYSLEFATKNRYAPTKAVINDKEVRIPIDIQNKYRKMIDTNRSTPENALEILKIKGKPIHEQAGIKPLSEEYTSKYSLPQIKELSGIVEKAKAKMTKRKETIDKWLTSEDLPFKDAFGDIPDKYKHSVLMDAVAFNESKDGNATHEEIIDFINDQKIKVFVREQYKRDPQEVYTDIKGDPRYNSNAELYGYKYEKIPVTQNTFDRMKYFEPGISKYLSVDDEHSRYRINDYRRKEVTKYEADKLIETGKAEYIKPDGMPKETYDLISSKNGLSPADFIFDKKLNAYKKDDGEYWIYASKNKLIRKKK